MASWRLGVFTARRTWLAWREKFFFELLLRRSRIHLAHANQQHGGQNERVGESRFQGFSFCFRVFTGLLLLDTLPSENDLGVLQEKTKGNGKRQRTPL